MDENLLSAWHKRPHSHIWKTSSWEHILGNLGTYSVALALALALTHLGRLNSRDIWTGPHFAVITLYRQREEKESPLSSLPNASRKNKQAGNPQGHSSPCP